MTTLRISNIQKNTTGSPALVGIQVKQRGDYDALLARMDAHRINYQTLNDEQTLFELLI